MKEEIKKLLIEVQKGKISIKEAVEKLKFLPYEDIGFAKIDTHRQIRKSLGEVIFCEGKTTHQIIEIIKKMDKFIATRANKDIYVKIKKIAPDAVFYESARIITNKNKKKGKIKKGKIVVITAGTADIPVAEEAAVIAEIMNNKVERIYDVGIAGIHRLFAHKTQILSANVIIVVAGMEGALPSIVSGIVDKPIIAVPTSTGYGASFKGLSALLTMINSCSPGVVIVNIDNGFGAGYFASLINK